MSELFSFKPSKESVALSVLLASIALATGVLHAQAADPAKDAAKAAKPALTVSVVKPVTSELSKRLMANGSVAAWQEMIVGAEVNGQRLVEVVVNVGDSVRKGQVLARFDAAGLTADLMQVRASLAEAEAGAAEAAANAERARGLAGTGALSAQQILQATTAELATKARVQAAKAAINAQELRLRQATVIAPDAGVISARLATVGAVSGPGQELFRMIRQGRLEWRAELTAAELAALKAGMQAKVSAGSEAVVLGRVRVISPVIDPQTRNGLVYVDLPDAAGLRAGGFARGEFEIGNIRALTVPQSALVLRDGFSYVFKLAKTKVQQQKVQLGARSGDRIEVVQGLTAEDQIVQSGAAFLADGDTVRVVPAK